MQFIFISMFNFSCFTLIYENKNLEAQNNIHSSQTDTKIAASVVTLT